MAWVIPECETRSLPKSVHRLLRKGRVEGRGWGGGVCGTKALISITNGVVLGGQRHTGADRQARITPRLDDDKTELNDRKARSSLSSWVSLSRRTKESQWEQRSRFSVTSRAVPVRSRGSGHGNTALSSSCSAQQLHNPSSLATWPVSVRNSP